MKGEKLKGSLPAKIAAFFVVIVSLAVASASAGAVVFLDGLDVYTRDEKEWLEQFNERLLERYSIYAVASYMDGDRKNLEELDRTNFRYGIIRSDDFDAVDLNDRESYLAQNMMGQRIDRETVNVYSCIWDEYTVYDYDMSLFGFAWLSNERPYDYSPVAHVPDEENFRSPDCYVVSYVNNPLAEGEGFYTSDLFAQAKLFADAAYAYRYRFVAFLFVSGILAVFAFAFLMCAAGHRNGSEELCRHPWDEIYLDVSFGAAFGVGAALVYGVILAGMEWNPLESLIFWLIAGCAGVAILVLVIVWSMSFALWWKLGKWWRHTLIYVIGVWYWKWCKAFGRLCIRVWHRAAEVFCSMRFLWKAWLILAALAGLELCAAFLAESEGMLMFLCFEKLILYPVIIFALLQLNRLRDGGRRLAAGDLTSRIDTSKMYWELKRHGENLNAIGDGMNAAVNERMKSERFKTELITNVSHDIKTPLTSIINYVDLLGKERLENPRAKEYLEVLTRQSARLKKLIEDLIEASKASTGNLAVCMEVCDAQVTLIQTIGEYEEKLSRGEIELRIKEPEEQIRIEADSRHLWRVFDNLMNNICKYAQPMTRAYVNFEQEGSRAVITFRNISREPLNITSEELMERFVRGDDSRSTEGNGLGLSIARSLTELMGGSLELVVDGDLFKVVLSFPVCGNGADFSTCVTDAASGADEVKKRRSFSIENM